MCCNPRSSACAEAARDWATDRRGQAEGVLLRCERLIGHRQSGVSTRPVAPDRQPWDGAVWEGNLASRGALNAGVSGDRTENLLWRLQNGNLDGPPPNAAVLLIGTNDLAAGRSPELAADGIRAVLEALRQHFPNTRILLLGLLPREEDASALLRTATTRVNRLIQECADGEHIVYANIGDVLLDNRGRLTSTIAPDGLHFTAHGYELLASRLNPELDRLLSPPR